MLSKTAFRITVGLAVVILVPILAVIGLGAYGQSLGGIRPALDVKARSSRSCRRRAGPARLCASRVRAGRHARRSVWTSPELLRTERLRARPSGSAGYCRHAVECSLPR